MYVRALDMMDSWFEPMWLSLMNHVGAMISGADLDVVTVYSVVDDSRDHDEWYRDR